MHTAAKTRTVIRHRLLISETIEERISEAALAHDILGDAGFARAFTRDDLDFLLAEV